MDKLIFYSKDGQKQPKKAILAIFTLKPQLLSITPFLAIYFA